MSERLTSGVVAWAPDDVVNGAPAFESPLAP
jgi:hypothetical protein